MSHHCRISVRDFSKKGLFCPTPHSRATLEKLILTYWSNFPLLLLLAMLILVQQENEQGETHIFQGIYFENSQIHLLTMMRCFEHINNDILLSFLFKNLYKFFFPECNLH